MEKRIKKVIKNYMETAKTDCAWFGFNQPKMPKKLIEKQLGKKI